jgi:hypothetical protein
MSRWNDSISIRAVIRMLIATVVLAVPVSAQTSFKKPAPGEVYKEYMQVISTGNDDWRVTDPNIDLGVYPAAADFLPNPVLSITIDDLAGATRAEALFSIWGGHIGTSGKKVSFNGNSWISIPEVTTPPTTGYNYIHQAMIGVDVPLGHLQQGSNSFTGTNGGQFGSYGFGWGQFGWYAIIVRVYFDPASKTHVTGSISSPGNNASIGENPAVAITVSGSASQVDVLAYYDGDDTDGDGLYQEYHHDYHRGKSDGVAIKHHVGSDFGSPWSVTWDNAWVPDQSGIKLLARIKGSNGVWYVTPEVTGLTLGRASSAVRLFKPYGIGEREWARGDLGNPAGTQQSYVDIPDLADATSAVFLAHTWNGIDGSGDPDHYTRVNSWYAPSYGENHYYSYDALSLPVGNLRTGQNLIEFKSNTTAHHGIEVLWPGSAIAVRYGVALPIQLSSLTAAVVDGGHVRVAWTTLSERNNYGFEVQKAAAEPANFQTVPNSFVPGSGTTLESRSYAFVDPSAPAGVTYYRLKQIDVDGSTHYSDPVRLDGVTGITAVQLPESYTLHQAYPNPFNPSTRIRFALPVSGAVRIRLFNQIGQEVRELVNGFRVAGSYEITLDADGLPSGVYYYRMESGPFVDAKKVVLLR